jgi:hypothetical protein
MGLFDFISGSSSVDADIQKAKESNASLRSGFNNLVNGFFASRRAHGGLIFTPTTPIFDMNQIGLGNTASKYVYGGSIVTRGTERLKDGGVVYEKGHPIGRKLHMEYIVKDVDSVPAILSPGEYVLTKPMIAKVKKVFKKQGIKAFKGM